MQYLDFRPFRGTSSPHSQTILASLTPPGFPPPSEPLRISLEDGDVLYAEVSSPPSWLPHEKTLVLAHGMGGSSHSNYIVRASRKFYSAGARVVRLNFRGAGKGRSLAQRTYHAGLSEDLLRALQFLKEGSPLSPITLIGFSLGGNVALKLNGELGDNASNWIERTLAVCPPVDLAQSIEILQRPANRVYRLHYLQKLRRYGNRWLTPGQTMHSIRDYDDWITAPQWGYRDSSDFYSQVSSIHFFPRLPRDCEILFAADDPFIDHRPALAAQTAAKIWICPQGGHMGFIGSMNGRKSFFGLDEFLLDWVMTR